MSLRITRMRLNHIFFAFFLTIAFSINAQANTWPLFKDVIVYDNDVKKFSPLEFKKHKLTVLYVTASWCASCKDINKKILNWQKKYQGEKIRFLSVHVHETKKEFLNALVEKSTTQEIYLADERFIKKFHNPTAPAVILFDHFGRVTSLRSNLKKIDYLEHLLLASSFL